MWAILDDGEREARTGILNLIVAGKAPNGASLAAALGRTQAEAGQLIDALVAKGFVIPEAASGAITAAYPLSVRPTRHRVTFESGRTVYALCAVDALGVSPLLGVSTRIETHCPHCEGTIRLDVHDGDIANKDPSTAVLWYSMADLLEKRVEGLNLSKEH